VGPASLESTALRNRDGFWGEVRIKFLQQQYPLSLPRSLSFLLYREWKIFLDARFQWVSLKTFEYNIIDYYFGIQAEK
jgi:hypothetical protein